MLKVRVIMWENAPNVQTQCFIIFLPSTIWSSKWSLLFTSPSKKWYTFVSCPYVLSLHVPSLSFALISCLSMGGGRWWCVERRLSEKTQSNVFRPECRLNCHVVETTRSNA